MKRLFASVLVVLILCSIVSPVSAVDKWAVIDAYVQAQFEKGGFPGGSYAIVQRDQVVLAKGIGQADRQSGRPATPDTIYASASITKALTATAVLLLAEQGKIDLEAPVQRYLPWFRYQDAEQSALVRVRHLLTHSAGVSRYVADGAIYRNLEQNRHSIENAVRELRNVSMNAKPGEVGQYCNTCFNTLGLVIEAVSGQPYEAFMKEQLFDPLGMKDTGFDARELAQERVAKEYGYLFGFSTEMTPYWKAFGKSQAPEGGAYTSAADLAKFLSAVMGYSQLPIAEAVATNAQTGVEASDRAGVVYNAAGYEEQVIEGTTVYTKSGDGMGSTSEILLIPRLETGVVLLIGESNGERRAVLAEGILHLLLDLQPQSVEKIPNIMRIAGYVALGFVLASLTLLAWLIRDFGKRRRANGAGPGPFWLAVRLCLLVILCGPLWYLLVAVRPTEAGLYGYPYDLFIGFASVAVVCTLGSLYTVALLLYHRSTRRG